ncbi:MAG: hypothetical protein ACRDF4_09550 [Rhabdochlamydiaceae bacterium]
MPNSSKKITLLQTSTTLPKLIVPRAEVREKLEAHIAKARELAQRPINSEEDMERANAEGHKWRDYAVRLLSTLFDTSMLADDYQKNTRSIFGGGELPCLKERDFFKNQMSNWWIGGLENLNQFLKVLISIQNISHWKPSRLLRKIARKPPSKK